MKRAYSYVRFSTVEQLQGKSLERQTESARVYCKQHNLELDTDLSLQDLGVSAFRGKNADIGALGAFLKAVHAGSVPSGSLLLVESFDRISREAAFDAQMIVQNIVNAGITIITLMDGKEYSVKVLRADPMALVYMILMFTRGHEESMTKSKRVADAWRRKRAELATGKALTACTPGWIKLDANRRPKLIPERVKIVRRIFTLFIEGHGTLVIAGRLTKDGVPTFRDGRWWSITYVKMVLHNRAVLGEFQPHRIDHSASKRKARVPDGEPIKDYWPAIIDTKTFNKTQARLTAARGKRSSRSTGLKNILAGLARCPSCDALMDRVLKTGVSPRLACSRARAGGGCKYRGVILVAVEAALAKGAAALAADVPDTTAELMREVARIEAQRNAVRRRLDDTADLLAETPSRTLANRLQEDESEAERLQAEIDRLNQQIHYGGARRIKDSVTRMRSALQWHATDPSDVTGVNSALRECFEKIVIDYQNARLVAHWRHGQMTALPY